MYIDYNFALSHFFYLYASVMNPESVYQLLPIHFIYVWGDQQSPITNTPSFALKSAFPRNFWSQTDQDTCSLYLCPATGFIPYIEFMFQWLRFLVLIFLNWFFLVITCSYLISAHFCFKVFSYSPTDIIHLFFT